MNRVYKSTKREKPVSPLVSYWRRLDKPLILAALLCSLLNVPMPEFSQTYVDAAAGDTDLRPKRRKEGPAFIAEPYVQVFSDRMPFQPNLSVADLLFAEGPEAVSVLRRCRL